MTKKLGVFIKNSSRDSVISSLKVTKSRYIPKGKLIIESNQLKKNAILAIQKHNSSVIPILPKKKFSLKVSDVSSYIAASSVSHLLDSWGYLSNAVNAYLNGNFGIAIHLAYYSELRAVMSLLASEGIGVFDNLHLGLESNDKFSIFANHRRKVRRNGRVEIVERKSGTHIFAWDALEKWCLSGVKPSYDILRLFRVKGHTFPELLPGFHPQATPLESSAIAKKWLKQWAFDVKKYRTDRELRNFVSYRPQTISGFDKQIDFKKAINNVYNLFQVLSPTINNPFNYLDSLLLKALFEELYQRPEISRRGNFEDLVKDSFEKVGDTFDRSLQRILLNGIPTNQSHLIFQEASKNEIIPLPVISRATLLLRVATGSTSILLKDADISKEELSFIWDNYGFNNGFWETPKPVSEFYTLWSEIESEFSEIETNMARLDSNSSFILKKGLEEDINKLSQFNRAILWGI